MKTPDIVPCVSFGRLGALSAAFALFAAALSAQTLFLDFGPTVTTTPSNSPYHSVVPTAGTTWNQVQAADVGSGLKFADGSDSTVTVNLGAGTYTSVNFASTPTSNNALGVGVNTGVFTGTSVGKDGIFTGTAGNPTAIAAQISGLAAGTYEIYVVAINTNSNPDNTGGNAFFDLKQRIGVAASAPVSGTFAPGATETVSNYGGYQNRPSLVGTWIDGVNYAKLSVTLAANENLIIYSLGTPSATGATLAGTDMDPVEEQRGFLNAIQIVSVSAPIPEPSAAAALAGVFALGAVGLRRRGRVG